MTARRRARRIGGWLALAPSIASLATMAVAHEARAERPPPSAHSAIVRPRLESPADVPYPAGAEGDADVVLRLTIAKDGTVGAADVDAGDEPFASAAKGAALGWRFSPATRDGAPVAARIRFQVVFRAPTPAPEPSGEATPAPSAPSAPSSVAPPKPPPRPIEVVVEGQRPPPSVMTMTRTEVRELPGAFGDPFRAIEALPGVTPIASGLPYFYVRGAPPGNVGYFLDGVRVPYLYHVAIGPSVVHPAMVERVDLYSGGYPARYGRYAGAIVAAETTAPRDDLHGEGNVRLFDAGAMMESGWAGGRGTALVGGRYSYTAALISLLAPQVKLDYRDYQARITYDLDEKDRVGLFAFGAYDLLAQEKNGIQSVVFGSEFYRFDARYDRKLPNGGTVRVATTWGFDQTRISEQRNAQDVLSGARVELTQPIDRRATVRAGADVQFDRYTADKSRWADPDDPDTHRYDALFPPRTDTALGAWADVVWKPVPRIEVTPGMRVDLYRSGGASAVGVDPRIAMRADVTDKVRLLHAFGVAHQPPSFILPVPGLAVGSLQGGLQTSLQASSGVEVDLPEKTTATVTVFNDVFLNMSDTLGVATGRRREALSEPRSLGSSYGLEVYVRKRLTSRLGGFVSYTLSRSTRSLDAASFPAAFDRTHVLNAALAFDLGRAWRAGTRLEWYTGAPVFGSASNDGLTPPPAPSDANRDPSFYRVDLRLEKRWKLGGSAWISFVAEMLNATLHKEIVNGEEIGPIAIPSVGAEGGF